jgi:hypothetical protein
MRRDALKNDNFWEWHEWPFLYEAVNWLQLQFVSRSIIERETLSASIIAQCCSVILCIVKSILVLFNCLQMERVRDCEKDCFLIIPSVIATYLLWNNCQFHATLTISHSTPILRSNSNGAAIERVSVRSMRSIKCAGSLWDNLNDQNTSGIDRWVDDALVRRSTWHKSPPPTARDVMKNAQPAEHLEIPILMTF